jgi:alkylation response protein AidB-like acyl-CoA dehydrogenase
VSQARVGVTESFVRVLLDGRVDTTTLTPFPMLSSGRIAQVNDLLAKLRVDDREATGVEHLRDWDLLTRPIDWSTPLLARVIRQVGGADASAALSAIAHLALGVRLIRGFGTEAQLSEFEQTPRALSAFALTEASPGSDVSRIQSHAEPVDGGFRLNGTKHWVTNGLWATHFIVVARTADPRPASKPRLTAFIVRAGPGVSVERVASDVLPGAGVAEVKFNDVFLAEKDVLGSVGKGFRVVMAGLSEARLFVGAAVLGACIRAFNDTISRVVQRRAFGRSVGKFPSVQARISVMISELLAMESLVHAVAGLSEPGAPVDPVERGVVRLAVGRSAARVLDSARELHGAAAYAGNVATSRHWADARALTLLDGSDLALESYIVLEGTREVRHRLARLNDSSDVLNRVDAAASLLVDKAKNRWRRVSNKAVPGVAVPSLHEYAARLGDAVNQAVRRYGSEIVERQHAQSRLAQITAELAMWSALSARVQTEVEQRGEVGARRMVEVASVWVHDAMHRVDTLLSTVEDNNDIARDSVAVRAYGDQAYPFDVF